MVIHTECNSVGANCSTLFFSNSYFRLAKKLSLALFREGQDPFQERYVLVPSAAMKQFVKRELAKHLKVFAGVSVVTLPEALKMQIKKKEKSKQLFSLEELPLFVQEGILQLGKKELPFEVQKELEMFKSSFSKLAQTSLELAEYFLQLDLYGEKLKKDKAFLQSTKGIIWQEIQEKKGEFLFPLEALSYLDSASVHLFGFSFLPQEVTLFFKKKKASFYLFSFCQEYWEDFCSEYEKKFFRHLLTKLKAKPQTVASFEAFVSDQHPLLASCGKKARLFLKQFAEEEVITEEDYEPIEGTSLLAKMQNDILHGTLTLQTVENFEEDLSLSIHACPSYEREVQVLHDGLYRFIEKAQEKGKQILTNEILVVVADLGPYIPYIQMIFGKKDSKLGYLISQGEEIRTDGRTFLEKLIDEENFRFEKSFLFSLLEIPSFQEKAQLFYEEIATLKEWSEKVGFSFGYDGNHQGQIEASLKPFSKGSLEQGIKSLLRGAVLEMEEESPLFSEGAWPISGACPSDIVLLKRWKTLAQALFEKIQLLFQEKKTPSEWFLFLKECLEQFLILKEEEGKWIKTLHEQARACVTLVEKVPFQGVKSALEKLLHERKGSVCSEGGNRIEFCSLQGALFKGHKVVCLLGMGEENFPKVPLKPLLYELEQSPLLDEKVHAVDESRSLFLEALLSAKEHLWISYCCCDEQSNPTFVSPVVKELQDAAVQTIPQAKLFFSHEPFGFSPKYFQDKIPYPSYSQKFFSLAQHLQEKKENLPPPLLSFEQMCKSLKECEEGEKEVDISDLFAFCKDAESFYKEKVLLISKKWEERPSYAQEFTLKKKDKAHFHCDRTLIDFNTLWKLQEEERGVPHGMMKEVIKEKQLRVCTLLHESYESFGIQETFSVKLEAFCQRPTLQKKTLFVPSLDVPLEKRTTVKLSGVFGECSEQGILLFEEKVSDAHLKAKILLALLHLHPDLKKQVAPTAFFMRFSQKVSFDEEMVTFLKESLSLFFKLVCNTFCS